MIEPDVVVVPAGDALLGDPPRTEHVNIFAIARRPVSVGEYAMFVDATQHHPPMGWEQQRRATGATHSGASMSTFNPGRFSRRRASSGCAMSASPIQLGATTRMRDTAAECGTLEVSVP